MIYHSKYQITKIGYFLQHKTKHVINFQGHNKLESITANIKRQQIEDHSKRLKRAFSYTSQRALPYTMPSGEHVPSEVLLLLLKNWFTQTKQNRHTVSSLLID